MVMKYVACIGHFDGVHLGHQKLIKKTKKISNTIYRYVGVDISTMIKEQNLCYEEYLERE